ncbi:MAG: BrnT family toxin [Novosphingobium sp.]
MDLTRVAGFDWDDGNIAKCQKHGVSIAEVESVFQHAHRLAPDVVHSTAETRFLIIGNGGGPRPIFVAFTFRRSHSETRIRPISARYMHRKEIEHHEQAAARPDQ